MFHYPPLVTIQEMKGDLPCIPELWDASTEEEFYSEISARGQDCWCRLVSVSGAVEVLMRERWATPKDFPVKYATMHDMRLLMFGIMSP